MPPLSHALAAMVARTANDRRRTRNPHDARQVERALLHALDELYRVRPRIVTFAPAVALKRVLAGPQALTANAPSPAHGRGPG